MSVANFCTQCGLALQSHARFCSDCGAKVATEQIKSGFEASSGSQTVSHANISALRKIDNTVIWVLACAPVIGIIIQIFIVRLIYGNFNAALYVMKSGKYLSSIPAVMLVTPFLNFALALWDEQLLKRAGVQTDSFSLWMFFLVPVYLFKRAKLLGHKLAYFVVWIVCFSLSLLV